MVNRFCMMESEVTQGAYQAVVASNPSVADYKGVSLLGSTLPVQNVSWYDAVAYANAVSMKEGLAPVYTINGTDIQWNTNANGYRLPTEAEWEYAARGGKTTVYAGTSSTEDVCRYGNVNNPSFKAKFGWSRDAFPCEDNYLAVAPIKSFQPNGYALYDLTGNVWEWVWDTYGPYSTSGNTFKADSLVDRHGNALGSYRVVRGGSWYDFPNIARVAYRGDFSSSIYSTYLGFRLSRTHS
jgi:formylglycine-generating enzyme required for sulfatase activity